MECKLLRKTKFRGYRKRMVSLWLNKEMFWVRRLVDQANNIRRNLWMTELKIEELERNFAENCSWKKNKVLMIQG